MRRIEDVFTIERAVAAFAPEKRRVPVQRAWIQPPEKDGDGAGKPVCMCLATAILLDEAGVASIPDAAVLERMPKAGYAMSQALTVSQGDLNQIVLGWDGRLLTDERGPVPLDRASPGWQLGAACWEAVQKARGHGSPSG